MTTPFFNISMGKLELHLKDSGGGLEENPTTFDLDAEGEGALAIFIADKGGFNLTTASSSLDWPEDYGAPKGFDVTAFVDRAFDRSQQIIDQRSTLRHIGDLPLRPDHIKATQDFLAWMLGRWPVGDLLSIPSDNGRGNVCLHLDKGDHHIEVEFEHDNDLTLYYKNGDASVFLTDGLRWDLAKAVSTGFLELLMAESS